LAIDKKLAVRCEHQQPNLGEAALDMAALYRHIVGRNRFLPIPKDEERFVGDGDFRAIGAEFLELFIRYGGLRPEWDVLDFGCGIGRMALPLTQYLDPTARYVGVDVNRRGIQWCKRRISRVYENFAFHFIDYENALYNPGGKKKPWDTEIPFEKGSFDFIFATSVFTHLNRQEAKAFISQLAGLLRPGGRFFATFFLIDEMAVRSMQEGRSRLVFRIQSGMNSTEAEALPSGSAVAFNKSWIEVILAGNGLQMLGEPLRGTWPGLTEGGTYQDLVVAEKPGLDRR